MKQHRRPHPLRESEERYRSLVELSQDAILVREGQKIVFVNPACAAMLGAKDPEELVSRKALDLVQPDYRAVVKDRMKRTDQYGERFGLSEQKFVRLDGAVIDVEVCSGPIFYGGRRSSHVIFRDITARKRVEEALRSSEERFRLAAQSATDLIYEWDVVEDCTEWFGDADAWLGYAPGKAPRTGRSFLALLHSEDRERVDLAVARSVRTGEPFREEYRIRAKDGTYRYWRVRAVAVRNQDGVCQKFIGACSDVTEQKKAEEALRENESALRRSQRDLRALTAELISAQEEVRREISRELHDDLNQRLPMLALEVETLKREMPERREEIQERLGLLRARLLEMSEHVRWTAYRLHPSVLEHLGLPVALKSLCGDFSKRERVRVRFACRRFPKRVSAEAALCLYRITQECLRNIAKHSEAQNAWVTLSQPDPQEVALTISDSGVGFDPEKAKARRGLGIVSMNERVRLLAGSFSIQCRPGGGTRVRVRLPATDTADAAQ